MHTHCIYLKKKENRSQHILLYKYVVIYLVYFKIDMYLIQDSNQNYSTLTKSGVIFSDVL